MGTLRSTMAASLSRPTARTELVAVLGGGRRLARKGRIQDAEHFVDARFGEMGELLSGRGGSSACCNAGR